VASSLDTKRSGVVLLVDEQTQLDAPAEYRRYEAPLSAIGLAPTRVERAQLDAVALSQLRVLVISQDVAQQLPAEFARSVADAVAAGLCVYTEGPSELSKLLNVSVEESQQ
jgi:hypothetical protein